MMDSNLSRRRRMLVSATCATLTLLPTAVWAATPVGAKSAAMQESPLADASLEAAALQLAVDHDLSLAEARSRMANQDYLTQLNAAAREALGPEAWGGSFIDQESDGALIIQSTKPDETAEYVRTLDARAQSSIRASVALAM